MNVRNFICNKNVEKVLLYLAVFLITIYTNVMCLSNHIYGNSMIIAGTFCVSIIIAGMYIAAKKKKITFLKYESTFLIMLVFMLINNYDFTLGNYNYVIKFVLFAVFIVLIKHLKWEKPFLQILLVISIAHAFISIFMLFNKDLYINNVVPLFDLNKNYYQKLMRQINEGCLLGIASHHSTSGIYFSVAYLVSIAFTFKGKVLNKKYGLLSIVFLICLVLTQKRGPLLFALIASLSYLYFYKKKESTILKKVSKKEIAYIIFLLVFIMLFICLVPLHDFFTYDNLNELSSERLEDLWAPAITLFSKHPIFGIGWGAYKYEYLDYSSFNVTNNNSHCIYLQLLAETGIVGFIIITSAMLITLSKTYKILMHIKYGHYKVSEEIKASIIFSCIMQLFFLLYGATGNPLYDYAVMLPYMLACGLCYSFIYKEKEYINKENKDKSSFKVAIVSAGIQPVPPVKGGAVETGIYQLVKEYDKDENRDFDLTVYSIYNSEAERISKDHKANFVFIKLSAFERYFNKIVFLINAVFRKIGLKISFVSDMPFLSKVIEDIKFNHFDVILIKNRTDFTIPISKVHDNVITQLHNDYLNKNIYKSKEIARRASKIVCVSEYIRKQVIEISEEAKNKAIVNLNCVDLDMFDKEITEERKRALLDKYEINNNDKVIVFSGRLNKQKGIKELLLSLDNLPKDLNYKLLIVGAPWYSSTKQNKFTEELNQIAKSNLEHIKFTGYVPYDKLWEIYQIADLAIVPSMWEEPAGRVLIEAEAAGVPLIITDAGGMREYVSDESAIVVKRDENLIQNLADEINNLLINEEKLISMGKKGREFVSSLNARRYYEEFVEFTRERKS